MRKTEKLTAPSLRFVGEQDGIPERALKARLSEHFLAKAIDCRAYLPIVEYETPGAFNVALCLKCELANPEPLVAGIANVFSGLFGADVHLDIMFLSDEQEREVQAVASSFFPAQPATG